MNTYLGGYPELPISMAKPPLQLTIHKCFTTTAGGSTFIRDTNSQWVERSSYLNKNPFNKCPFLFVQL